MRTFRARRIAVASATLIVMAAVIVGQLLDAGNRKVENVGFAAGIAVPFTILGALVLASLPRHPVGRLMTAAGVTAAVNLVALSWTDWTPLARLAQWTWCPVVGLVFLAILLFPDGRLPSRRWRAVAAAIVVGTTVGTVMLAAAAVDQPRFATAPGARLHLWASWLVYLFRYPAYLAAAGFLGALVSLGARWRRADLETRRQLVCLLPAGIGMLLGLALDVSGLGGAWAVAAVAVPLGMAVAILRHHLYDVDLVVNRTIVWLVMTGLVLLGFVAIVALTGKIFPHHANNATLIASGLVVVAFQPVHRRVQHGVDHLLYGDRDDPYLVIARLAEVLGCTVEPTAVMPLVTGTIAGSLHVPYVAVELEEPDGPVVVAEHGRPVTMTESFDMVSRGERIGRLRVGRRSTGARFSRHECRLLRNIARQAAVAAEATRLNRDLQTSREQLVTAREEERRRLRRDLHDGLGPSLAGMSLQVRAALRSLPGDSRAAQILAAVGADLKSCTAAVRQLVDELRPPVLDRGLEAAIRAECRRFDAGPLAVEYDLRGTLEGLPAAIEVAAFRIVAEALTNASRHSHGSTCRVWIHRNESLTVDVVDDGVGIGTSPPGVGLSSMRERAAELGGSCVIGDAPGGGTSVRLDLPLEPVHRAVHTVGQP